MRAYEDVAYARRGAVLFDLSERYGVVLVGGPDSAAFLQPITSNDVKGLVEGSGQHNALLDKQSCILAEFHIYRRREDFLLLTERFQVARIIETLEYYHFAEDVEIRDVSADLACLALQGPAAPAILQALSVGRDVHPDPPRLGAAASFTGDFIAPAVTECSLGGMAVHVLWQSLTGDEGFIIVCRRADLTALRAAVAAVNQPCAARDGDDAVLDILRLEAGLPRYGREMDAATRVLDTGMGESMVSFDKGCFPGQEIVARIKSRGEVSRRLMGLVFDAAPEAAGAQELFLADKQAGTLLSVTWSPTLGATIGMAYLLRKIANDAGRSFDFRAGGAACPARVVQLPFYVSPGIRASASRACDEGVAAFHRGDFSGAEERFAYALRIVPDHADALEGLGVALERAGRLDDAVRANAHYADLHPTAIMAHTNLSRLYMLKGLKEKAEEEQAKATMIKFRAGAGPAVDHDEMAAERQRELAAERRRKMAIFRQVLEIDEQDEVANFGIGSILLDEGQFTAAVPHLRTVVQNNAVYSAAYLLLARALIASGDTAGSADVLRRGIDAARANGDMMPLKAMEEMAGGRGR